MKMWKNKSWQLEATGVEGNVQLFGVNIFDFEWKNTNGQIQLDEMVYPIPVYQVTINGENYEFAALERSICVEFLYFQILIYTIKRRWFYAKI